MLTPDMIAASEFCTYHNIELSFIHSLQHTGLIAIVVEEDHTFIPLNELPQLEKMVRLYYEMDINLEGIETITHLLQRMNDIQKEMKALKIKMGIYEG